jgi:starch phosphorylase
MNEFTAQECIAYFTMEVALRSEIPTYSGGLGVLAGDTVRSAADLELPFVTVSLVSRAGYFRQEIDADGRQIEHPDIWQPERWARALDAMVAVPIEGRDVWVKAWLYLLEGEMGGRQPVILLDTDVGENNPADREITHYLYGGDQAYRLKQEVVLGIGGVRMLRALGFQVREYHLNEGHSALLTLQLLRDYAYPQEDVRPGEPTYDIPRVREVCNFTTHTPVEAGHDKFSYELFRRVLGDFIDLSTLKGLAGADCLNMTRLALNLSEYVNGVAARHAEVSQRMFPGYKVRAVTNGVHPHAWTSAPFVRLYDKYLTGWCHEPSILVRVECYISDEEIWQAHLEAKAELLGEVEKLRGVRLDPDVCTLGFARRMTAYKRPELLFSRIDRLREIAKKQSLQVVLAGKAHPHDEGGKYLIEQLHAYIRELAGAVPTVFLPNYDMALAHSLVSGVDVWLNTPLRPLEASGTSGMKAAFNGVPNLSVLDGWWIEGCIEGVTGWAIGDSDGDAPPDDDARALYTKLDEVVLPLYYGNRTGWIAVMKGAISKNAYFFNSHRMMRRYSSDAYLR